MILNVNNKTEKELKYQGVMTPRGRLSEQDIFNGWLYGMGIWDQSLQETNTTPNNLKIKNVYYNEKSGITVVIFEDDTKIIKKLSEGDVFDLRTAVALAIAEKVYSSKTQFNKAVEKVAVDQLAKKNKKESKGN